MRVVLCYGEEHKIKVKLPKKWLSGPTDKLKETLVDNYNTKHPEDSVDGAQFHLELEDGTVLCSDDIVEKRIPDRATIKLVTGPSSTVAESAAEAKRAAEASKPVENPNDPLLHCKHFGCQKKYRESENHDTFCSYHKSPPVFHETAKYWSCCPDKKAYDWDTFMAIPGCAVGRCTNEGVGKKSALGGSDVRAAAKEQNEFAPQRMSVQEDGGDAAPGAPTPLSKGRVMTPLDKLSALRKAMIGIGVDGVQFDSARDTMKTRNEELGSEVWKQVSKEMAAAFTSVLEKIEMQQETN